MKIKMNVVVNMKRATTMVLYKTTVRLRSKDQKWHTQKVHPLKSVATTVTCLVVFVLHSRPSCSFIEVCFMFFLLVVPFFVLSEKPFSSLFPLVWFPLMCHNIVCNVFNFLFNFDLIFSLYFSFILFMQLLLLQHAGVANMVLLLMLSLFKVHSLKISHLMLNVCHVFFSRYCVAIIKCYI